MKKILIQIPCYNEENVLEKTIIDIKKYLPKEQIFELLVIDDGSTDKTIDIAKKNQVDHILTHERNLGLGFTFETGKNFAIKKNFDYLINTDADNQYSAKDIKKLVDTILLKNSDIVIGARRFEMITHFSFLKKKLQHLGSWIVKIISGQKISDASSGFRIYSKKAINKISCSSKFSYTLDTLIQAGDKNLFIDEVFISTNAPTRKSRLFRSNSHFILNQSIIILKCFSFYKPFKFFFSMSIIPILLGLLAFFRFIYYFITSDGSGHIQSLIFGSTFILLGFLLLALGVIGEQIKNNRKLIEELNEKRISNNK